MNDVLLYTFPQQDGKYRLKNNLPLSGLKVSVFDHLMLQSTPSSLHIAIAIIPEPAV